jgi:hypothetical protein
VRRARAIGADGPNQRKAGPTWRGPRAIVATATGRHRNRGECAVPGGERILVGIARRAEHRFHSIGGRDRALGLAGQAFLAFIPLVTFVGAVMLLASLLSFARLLKGTFEAAWELPSLGMRGAVSGFAKVALLL